MKIFDCFSYWDEDLLLDLRLNILSDHVDYFVVCESLFDHKGKENVGMPELQIIFPSLLRPLQGCYLFAAWHRKNISERFDPQLVGEKLKSADFATESPTHPSG